MVCKKCGAEMSGADRFCPVCGARQEEQDFTSRVQNLNNTEDTTDAFSPEDVQQNKAMAILAYLGILVLIPIFAAPNSKFARFHANQGLVLAIAEVAYAIIYAILSAILYAISWRLGFIMTIVGILGIAFAVLAIIGIVNAANGRAKALPVIGKISILK